MKIITWNVNGYTSALDGGLRSLLEEGHCDALCLQETKISWHHLPIVPGYRAFWACAEKSGYSGTAILTQEEPLDVIIGTGIEEFDREGRCITIEMDEFFLINAYAPYSRVDLSRLEYRRRWELSMLALLCRLQKSKPVILCGDLNVAAEDIDVFKPEGHHHDAGFTDDERGWHRKLKEEAGLIDVWRMLNKEVSSFTWFSSIEARMLDVGMRLDYILVSHKLLMPGPCPWLAFAEHRRDILGSDHCPVLLELQRINT